MPMSALTVFRLSIQTGNAPGLMNSTNRILILCSALALPLTIASLPWKGDPESAVPATIQSDFDANTAGTQQGLEESGVTQLRAPLTDAGRAEASAYADKAGQFGVAQEGEPQGGGFWVMVIGADEQFGEGIQGHVFMERMTPEYPAWSAEAMLMNGKANFGDLPEGEFRVDVVSDVLSGSVSRNFAWSGASETAERRFEFDLAAALEQSNQKAVVATLRSIAAAQQQLQASGAIDTDGDGGGQYGFFGELAGTTPLRIYGSNGGTIGGPADVLDPPFLASSLGAIKASHEYGCILRKGYYFRIHLPALTPEGESVIAGVFESPQGGAGTNSIDPSRGELFWGVYAWPAKAGTGAQSTFFINQDGDVAERRGKQGQPYIGLHSGPAFDAAYSNQSPGDMSGAVAFAAMGFTSNDGAEWTQVGN